MKNIYILFILTILLLMLIIFLFDNQVRIEKENNKSNPISCIIGQTIELGINDKVICYKSLSSLENIEIEVKDIIVEEIIASPDNSYPAGSGIIVNILLKKESENKTISLNKISEGYESQLQANWKGYNITLIQADTKSIKLKIE